jgi:hypothetical protein
MVHAWMRAVVAVPPWALFALVDIIFDEQLRDMKDERRKSADAARNAAS